MNTLNPTTTTRRSFAMLLLALCCSAALAICLGIAGLNVIFRDGGRDDTRSMQRLGQLERLSLDIATLAERAGRGDADAMEQLADARRRGDTAMADLAASGILPVNALHAAWQAMRGRVDGLVAMDDAVAAASQDADSARDALAALRRAQENLIHATAERIDATAMRLAVNQLVILARVERDIATLESGNPSAIDALTRDLAMFDAVMSGQANGDQARSIARAAAIARAPELDAVRAAFPTLREAIERMVDDSLVLVEARDSASRIAATRDKLEAPLTRSRARLQAHPFAPGVLTRATALGAALAALLLACALALGLRALGSSRVHAMQG